MKKRVVVMYALLGMPNVDSLKFALFKEMYFSCEDEADEYLLSALAEYALDGARKVLDDSNKNGLYKGSGKKFVTCTEDDIRFLVKFLHNYQN